MNHNNVKQALLSVLEKSSEIGSALDMVCASTLSLVSVLAY
jgi:hypothetical protein